jgi:hypothetical protein
LFLVIHPWSFQLNKVPIGSVFAAVQYRLKRDGEATLPQELKAFSTEAMLQFSQLAWLCEDVDAEKELEDGSTGSVDAERELEDGTTGSSVPKPLGQVCGICGDSPEIMVFDGTMKFICNLPRSGTVLWLSCVKSLLPSQSVFTQNFFGSQFRKLHQLYLLELL